MHSFGRICPGESSECALGARPVSGYSIKKGVPYCSVLGPVLLNVFVNDLYAAINSCDLCNYVDDNTIYIKS